MPHRVRALWPPCSVHDQRAGTATDEHVTCDSQQLLVAIDAHKWGMIRLRGATLDQSRAGIAKVSG